MPEMDGLEASKRIQETYKPEDRPRIIALSADTVQVGSAGAGVGAGAALGRTQRQGRGRMQRGACMAGPASSCFAGTGPQ